MSNIQTGLDTLLSQPRKYLQGSRVGLIVNHTSVARDGRLSILHFKKLRGVRLHKLFAPEHGLYGVDQDMVGIEEEVDPCTGLPVQSLYGHDAGSLAPDPSVLGDLDALIFDIQDIGSRYYTFVYTLANCMKACGQAGVPVVVCDRPNPINGLQVEGNLVRRGWHSFVGQYALPNRHGMTVGELALMFRDYFGIRCDLTVVHMKGWERAMWFDQTGLLWVPPSPNMPHLSTATVYPGMCLVEGTCLSEGRGTTLPFEQTGAPGIDSFKLADALNAEKLPGVRFRPHYFKPTFHKWAGQICGGVQVHVTRRERFKPFLTGLAVLRAIRRLFPKIFGWRTEPYEFVSDRLAIDLLYGHAEFRRKLLSRKVTLADIETSWRGDLREFKKVRRDFLLY